MTDNRPTLEIIAPTVDEAIEKGLIELGLSREDVDIKILDEGSAGLFGLRSRQARILLIILADVEEDIPKLAADPKPIAEPQDRVAPKDHEQILEATRSTLNDLLEKMKIEATLDVYIGETYEIGRAHV